MNERYFKFAREASLKADYKGSNACSPRIGAVAVYKGSIVAEAFNTNKTSPIQARYNIYRFDNDSVPAKQHCENLLYQRLRWTFGESLDWTKVDIYLYREYRNGKMASSRPCPSCMKLLKDDLKLKRVFYTTPDGVVEERFR